jgi:hypothetical protein
MVWCRSFPLGVSIPASGNTVRATKIRFFSRTAQLQSSLRDPVQGVWSAWLILYSLGFLVRRVRFSLACTVFSLLSARVCFSRSSSSGFHSTREKLLCRQADLLSADFVLRAQALCWLPVPEFGFNCFQPVVVPALSNGAA